MIGLVLFFYNLYANTPHGQCWHTYDPQCNGCKMDTMNSELRD